MEVSEYTNFPLYVTAIRVQRQANMSKQTTLLGGVDVDPPKWHECGRGINRTVHEGIKDISNSKVLLKARSGYLNINNLPSSDTFFF